MQGGGYASCRWHVCAKNHNISILGVWESAKRKLHMVWGRVHAVWKGAEGGNVDNLMFLQYSDSMQDVHHVDAMSEQRTTIGACWSCVKVPTKWKKMTWGRFHGLRVGVHSRACNIMWSCNEVGMHHVDAVSEHSITCTLSSWCGCVGAS